MAAICPDFKQLGFGISDPIQNPDYFASQPLLDRSKSRLVRISDPHCSCKFMSFCLPLKKNFLYSSTEKLDCRLNVMPEAENLFIEITKNSDLLSTQRAIIGHKSQRYFETPFSDSSFMTLYSGDLNTGLVWYSNGQKLFDHRMFWYLNAT